MSEIDKIKKFFLKFIFLWTNAEESVIIKLILKAKEVPR